MPSPPTINLKPVGYVRTQAVGSQVKDKTRTAEIVIDPQLQPALDGITDYSHVYVLFWLHQIPKEKLRTLNVRPRGRSDMPLVGVFAARTNLHPNPVGLTVVELLKVEGNVLTVRGLDAFEGSPILDIKPYDTWDKIENPKLPRWWLKLEQEKKNSESCR